MEGLALGSLYHLEATLLHRLPQPNSLIPTRGQDVLALIENGKLPTVNLSLMPLEAVDELPI